MASIRTFIALPTSAGVQQAMAEIQERLKAADAEVKWESPDKFHITLKFLGNLEPSKIELLAAGLTKGLSQCDSFDLLYESLGAFPNPLRPRVVWIGAQPSRAVLDLQAIVEQICAGQGFPKENRTFHPHITLGRVKDTQNLARLTEAIKNTTFEPLPSLCAEVVLMKSDLHPRGSSYTELKSIALHSRSAGQP
jgi:2'-5' RNA ligase